MEKGVWRIRRYVVWERGREGREGEKSYIRCEGLWEYESAALERVLMKFCSNEFFLG